MYHIHPSLLEHTILPFFIIAYYEYDLIYLTTSLLIFFLQIILQESRFNTVTYIHYINLL